MLIYDNHTLPLRIGLPFFFVAATIKRNDMKEKLAKVAAIVQSITESHAFLYGRLLVAFEAYAKRQLPPREERISRILDCEGNGAHTLIENFATAIKAVPRGELGSYPDLFLAECTDFLNYLEDNLMSSECAEAIWDIRQIEERFSNFIKGISGADPNISPQEYSHRIDKFVRDMKLSFGLFSRAIIRYEFSLCHNPAPARNKENAKRKKQMHEKSHLKEWTQNDAAKMLGITTRQLRRYKKAPPSNWPGWEDPITLKKWLINQNDKSAMAIALKNSLPYKEGITEKSMKHNS